MTKVISLLVGILCAFSVSAVTNQGILKNLSNRLQKLPKGRGELVKSFTDHSQSYIYDQALTIIAFTKANDQKRAKSLLRALESLQLSDGSLYFSYYMDGTSPYPEEGDKRYAGAIAWVALAAVHYQSNFKSDEFVGFNLKILNYLKTQIHPIKIKDTTTKALSFAPTDVPSTPWKENETAALEHNLDAYSAFLHFSKINKTHSWKDEIDHLKTFILTMWDKDQAHFWSGANLKTGSINKSELYLDNQTWSLLALDKETLKSIKPADALNLNCETFLVNHEGIVGFMDSRPVRRPASQKFVWSEGSLGQILAMKRTNITCNNKTSNDFLSSIKKMKKADGGIAYATSTSHPDFTSSSSVAGTAWMYFATNDINPFEIDG
jgi:hypothetical protein